MKRRRRRRRRRRGREGGEEGGGEVFIWLPKQISEPFNAVRASRMLAALFWNRGILDLLAELGICGLRKTI